MSDVPTTQGPFVEDFHLDPDYPLQSIEWIDSIHQRFGEKLSALLASRSLQAADLDASHIKQASSRLEQIGIDASTLEEALASAPPKLSGLDDPHARRITHNLYKEIMDAIDLSERDKPRKVIVASVPSASISAFCVRNGWDEFDYIFFDVELLTFCNMISKIVYLCIKPLMNDEGALRKSNMRRHIEVARSKETRRRTFDLYFSIIMLGFARASSPYIPEKENIVPSYRICENMELFVMAHEMAHSMLNHFDAKAGPDGDFPGEGTVMDFSHQQEYEADLFGWVLLQNFAFKKKDISILPLMAPYIFIKSIELLYLLNQEVNAETTGPLSSHPHPADRAKRIAATIEFYSQKRNDQEGIMRHLRQIDQVFFWLYRDQRDAFAAVKKSGIWPLKKMPHLSSTIDRPAILGIADSSSIRNGILNIETKGFRFILR